MSMDALQGKIRRCHNPAMLHLELTEQLVPEPVLTQAGSLAAAYGRMCRELLEALRGIVPAVRVSFACFALLGAQGLTELEAVLRYAQNQGFYVLLDWMRGDAPAMAEATAKAVFDGSWHCDGITLLPYLGSDSVTPFLPYCKAGKTVFVVAKTPNRSSFQLQDLMTGGRLVHTAVADLCGQLGQDCLGRCGYSQVAAVASANAPDSLRQLRVRYPRLFLLVDGYNFTSGNGRTCSEAFDQLGRGAIVCAGSALVGAWRESPETDYVTAAVAAAERMKKILGSYITTI